MKTIDRDKTEIIRQSRSAMETLLPADSWSARQKVALACRILFNKGHDSGLAGQISARAEEPGTYYTQRLGLGFDEITCRNLLVVDEDLNVLCGEGMANPANRFHSWIYRARPDVGCVIHTHPLHASALSMLERPLKISHMDSCMLYDEVAPHPKWPGVPFGNEEGKLISSVIGNKRAAMLGHHGLVVAAAGVEEACAIAVQIERTAQMQLLAEAAGEIHDIDPSLAREAHDWILQPKRSSATFAYFSRQALKRLSREERQELLDDGEEQNLL